jgi:ABC-type multidrug transport system fused ATPase/permease subunit
MEPDFNNRIRQIFFLLIIIALALIVFRQLYIFFPGFLGAVTLYILCRKYFFHLTEQKKVEQKHHRDTFYDHFPRLHRRSGVLFASNGF